MGGSRFLVASELVAIVVESSADRRKRIVDILEEYVTSSRPKMLITEGIFKILPSSRLTNPRMVDAPVNAWITSGRLDTASLIIREVSVRRYFIFPGSE